MAKRYLIEEPCERSSTSAIYRARHLTLDRAVLLRLLVPRSGLTRESCRSALALAERAATLASPHVARALDVGVVSERWPFIVSEYSKGMSLQAVVSQGPLGLARALPIARQLASALASAHGAGLLHGEVRLDGVWVESSRGQAERVRMLDFGLSMLSQPGDGTSSSGVFPSPRPAPALAGPPCAADARADIEALGSVLYQLAGGTLPGAPARALAGLLPADPSGSGWTGQRALARGFLIIVRRCLSLLPEMPYPSMAAVSADLDNLAETAATIAPPRAPQSPPVTAVHSPARRARVLLGGPKVIVRGG